MDLTSRMQSLAKEYSGVKKIALSYSGGLESSVVGSLLMEAGFEVVPVVVNMGQVSDFGRVERNARKMFGEYCYVDARERLTDSILRAVKSNYGSDGDMNSGGISRPVLALALSEVARKMSCQAVAHGSSGTGNDHLTMENSLRVLVPEIRIMAMVRDLDMRRDEALIYAKKQGLLTNLPRAQQYSADENLWARTIRQGVAVDYSKPIPESAYKWTVSSRKAPATPAEIEIDFLNGTPVSVKINGKKADKANMMAALNSIGGSHGVGRLETMDDKVVGLKMREAYECPGAMILLEAHRELERITLTTKELDAKKHIDATWMRLVHDGGWYTRLRRSLDAFTDETQKVVDGTVYLQLYKGSIMIEGRKSRHALYDARLSGRDSKGLLSQKEARSFAKLHGLQDVIAYLIDVESGE